MPQLEQLAEQVQSIPKVYSALLLLFLILGLLQYKLGPKDDWVEGYRDKYLLKLHEVLSLFGGYSVVVKGKAEYTYSAKMSDEDIEKVLYNGEYHRNVLAAKKRRVLSDGTLENSLSSWVYRESIFAKYQGHATIFSGHNEGEVDIYHHYETSWVTHPIKHYFDVEQYAKDPKLTLRDALDKSGVEYYYDEKWV